MRARTSQRLAVYRRRGRRLGYETKTHGTRKKAFGEPTREERRAEERDILRYILIHYNIIHRAFDLGAR